MGHPSDATVNNANNNTGDFGYNGGSRWWFFEWFVEHVDHAKHVLPATVTRSRRNIAAL